jgi:hypothetical protein
VGLRRWCRGLLTKTSVSSKRRFYQARVSGQRIDRQCDVELAIQQARSEIRMRQEGDLHRGARVAIEEGREALRQARAGESNEQTQSCSAGNLGGLRGDHVIQTSLEANLVVSDEVEQTAPPLAEECAATDAIEQANSQRQFQAGDRLAHGRAAEPEVERGSRERSRAGRDRENVELIEVQDV